MWSPGNKLVANSVTFYLESDKTLPQKEGERERKRDRLSQTRRAHRQDRVDHFTQTHWTGTKNKQRDCQRRRERIFPFICSIQGQDMTEEGQIDSLKYHSATVLVSSFVSVSRLHTEFLHVHRGGSKNCLILRTQRSDRLREMPTKRGKTKGPKSPKHLWTSFNYCS